MRRLHAFRASDEDLLRSWTAQREWLEFSSVNVFIGANGAGKSTVLDLIDILRQPGRLVTLPRENRPKNSLAALDIDFSNGDILVANIVQNRIDGCEMASNIDSAMTGFHDIQCVAMYGFTSGNQMLNLERNISKFVLDEHTQSELEVAFAKFGVNVVYWVDDEQAPLGDLVAELNSARKHLCGVLSESEYIDLPFHAQTLESYKRANPWSVHGDGRLSVYLSDDSLQHNNVAVSALPAGWRQLASILSWLKTAPRGSICLLEEPETHLHPHLQRYLAGVIGSLAKNHQLQIFIATHSPVFQQINLWPDGASLFEARPDRIAKLNSAWPVLDALGIKSSDLSQSNGIIWVEGPSDRLYIKHWLKLYCADRKVLEPVENVDYAFCFYGGATLSHFDADAVAFIDMLRINRNLAIVFDNDNDFARDAQGQLVCGNTASAKYRMLEKLNTLKDLRFHAWVTDGYTIESYLPDELRTQHFDDQDGRLVLKPHHRKVEVAMQYQRGYPSIDGYSCVPRQLNDHVAQLLAHIRSWNY